MPKMPEEVPPYHANQDSGDEQPVRYVDHTGVGFPAPQAVVLPGGFDEIHAIVSGLMADKADLQNALRHADAQREELHATVAACRAELATAQQALAGWAAQEAVRTGGNRRSPAERFIATARAWRPYLPYAQQAAIIAGLLAEEGGENP